jgi:cystathionine beta-lyase/cystathionine gamma-synthase
MSDEKVGWHTRLLHAGELPQNSAGAINLPIYQSSTFEQREEDTTYDSLRYIRLNNLPNQQVLAAKLAALEGAEAGVVTASGMAAISAAILSCLRAGDHLLAQDVLYGGTRAYFSEDLTALGIEVDFIASDDPRDWGRARKKNTRAIYVETLTNPLLHVTDLAGIASFAREAGLVSIIDNTIATPINFRPLEHGFDLSVHSATKYLNGHNDIVAGAVVGSAQLVERALHKLNHLGGSLDPHACFLLHRGIKSLKLRLDHQSQTALALASFLQEHERVERVFYPGLASHPSHARAKELLGGFSALLSFSLTGGKEGAERMLRRVRLPHGAPSFGGMESLITRPAASSHASLSAEARKRLGIDDGLIRVAVGIEDADDLIADFAQALAG